jgi:hypothetical protein
MYQGTQGIEMPAPNSSLRAGFLERTSGVHPYIRADDLDDGVK